MRIESGSRRIIELINKGIDLDKRLDLLRDSVEAGICNTVILSSYCKCIFTSGKHARLKYEPKKFGTTEIKRMRKNYLQVITLKHQVA